MLEKIESIIKSSINKISIFIKIQKKFVFELVSLVLVATMFFVLIGVVDNYQTKIEVLNKQCAEISDYAHRLEAEIKESKELEVLLGGELEAMFAFSTDIATELSKSVLDRTDDSPGNVRQLIYSSASHYGVDPIMCIAIARHESGNFSSKLFKENYNLGGIKTRNGNWVEYNSLIDGVNSFVLLIKSYCDKGLYTPEEIGPIYCPDGTSWAGAVRRLMEEEESRGYNYYEG